MKAHVLASILMAIAAAPAAHAEGEFDTTFSGDGYTTVPPSTGYGYQSRGLPDGRIVVGTTFLYSFRLAVLRLLEDGTPDPAFGNQGASSPGRSQFDMASYGITHSSSQPAGFAVSPDGARIYLSGNGLRFGLHQYGMILGVGADGKLDPTFGTGGAAGFNFYAPFFLASDPDGRVTGLAADASVNRRYVFRLMPDGSLDPSFGGGAFVAVTPPPGPANLSFSQLLRAVDGSYYLIGTLRDATTEENRAAIVRMLPDGTRDTAFAGGSGIAIIDFNLGVPRKTSSGKAALLADGKLVLVTGVGTTSLNGYRCGVARLTADGLLDPAFGNGGMRDYGVFDPSTASSNDTRCHDVVVRRDGRMIVTGRTTFQWFSMALDADGAIYSNYGTAGIAPGGMHSVLDRYDRLMLTTYDDATFNPYIARLTANEAIFEDGFEF